MKKIFITLAIIFGILFSGYLSVNAEEWNKWDLPTINCYWLPGCSVSSNKAEPEPGSKEILKGQNNVLYKMLGNIVSTLIQVVWVVSVVAIVISGFMMLLSWGDEEKVKTAKKWVIWSLVWVFASISSYGIISIIDNLEINLDGGETSNNG